VSVIKEKSDYIIIEEKSGEGSKKIFWVFFLIILFILVIFPIFGTSMRYRTGTTFSKTFALIGIVSFTLGLLIIAWGILMLFCTRSFKAIGVMLVGFCLVVVGSLFANPGLFGIVAHGEEVPRGYS